MPKIVESETFTDLDKEEISLSIIGARPALLMISHTDAGPLILYPETVKSMLPYLVKFVETGKLV